MKKFFGLVFLLLFFSFQKAYCGDLSWQTHVFPDGFTLITDVVPYYPVAAVHLFVRVGSVDENPQINGISHLYEHMFFKGTPTRDATEMKTYIEDYGGEINGSTYRDYTEFMVDIPSIYTNHAIDYLMDAFLHASLDPKALEDERKVVLDEVSLDAANPERQLSETFQEEIYRVNPYRMPIEGNETTVKNITDQDLIYWKKTYYVPSNAVLVVVGDIDPNAVVQQVGKILQNVNPPHYNLPIFPKEPEKTKPVIVQEVKPVNQAYLLLGYLVAGLDTPENIYPLDVMTFMLGYGRDSLLNRELKEKKKLVDAINADFLTEPYPGTLQIEAVCSPQNVDSVKASILEILDRLKKGEITPQELQRSKTLLSAVYNLGNETDSGKADTIGFYAIAGNAEFCRHYLANIRKVTIQDIERVANLYFKDNYVEVVYLPEKPPKTPEGKPSSKESALR